MRLLLAAALLAATPATAHVTLDREEAPAGSYVRLAIRVPHGCEGAATTGIRLDLPPGLGSVKPGVKPGWILALTPGEPGPTPAGEAPHGPAPRAVAWRGGPLPDAFYDEFLLMIRTPATPGATLALPIVQDCEGGATARWTERPQPGQPRPRFPAPLLRLTPRP